MIDSGRGLSMGEPLQFFGTETNCPRRERPMPGAGRNVDAPGRDADAPRIPAGIVAHHGVPFVSLEVVSTIPSTKCSAGACAVNSIRFRQCRAL